MKSRVFILMAIVALTAPLLQAGDDAVYFGPGQIKWQPAPPDLPKGAKLAVLQGDPGQPGPFTIRLSMPAGYTIPPHKHTHAESVTVISGVVYVGLGETFDKAGLREIKTGGFQHLGAQVPHFAWTKGKAVIQVQSEGPFDIHFFDPPAKADMQ
ncbi:cupin domain-containing protein [Jeongeupia wiesaeckerbachi]|uniref:cupin domain-containing protein n=1 Tax=Jeongeupia wiesaeckerbachi TaxID=3051218 RepID=UPI003D802B07